MSLKVPALCGLVLLVICFGSASVFADPIEDLLVQIVSKDFREASAAAKQAASYPYKEVADKLLETLNRGDVNAGNPSFAFVITYALESLKTIGSTGEVKALQVAHDNIQRLTKGTKGEIEINRAYNEALAAMKLRLVPLKKIADSPPLDLPPPVVVASDPSLLPLPPALRGPPSASSAKKLKEWIDSANLDAAVKTGLANFLAGVEKNLYDRAIEVLKGERQAPEYSFRDSDLKKLAQALLRSSGKAHALLTGKAGVGKTTVVEMLQQGWVDGKIRYPGANIPVILELSILDVTNPTDPTALKSRILGAEKLGQALNTHVVLFVDEAHVATEISRNAIKSFLTERANHVHLIWTTTSAESRSFARDTAFARRWTDVYIREFNSDEAIQAVRRAELNGWLEAHKNDDIALKDISADAYKFAERYRRLEQPHAGNPTGLKELIEGGIIYRQTELDERKKGGASLSEEEKSFVLEPEDIRGYLKFQKGLRLIPGDPQFENIFKEMWDDFRRDYPGQDGSMAEVRDLLRGHFGTLDREMVLTLANFGPPGGGKSFLGEMLAKHFFNNALLPVNSGMFGEGGHPLNVLIGSPTGSVGSEEQRSILSKFVRENPNGGIVLFEEADYLPQQVLDFLAEAITKKEFTDGLGQVWSLENFVFIMNSNMGQELLIPSTKVTWEEYNTRKMALTQKMTVNGQDVEVVRSDKLDEVFTAFKTKIARGRHRSDTDSTEQKQNGVKFNRRIHPIYTLLPSREELYAMGLAKVRAYAERKKSDYGVEFEGLDEVVDGILDLDNYRFDLGYSYVEARLTGQLFNYLNMYLSHKGHKVKVRLEDEPYSVGRMQVMGKKLVFEVEDRRVEHVLNMRHSASDNPWFENSVIKDRIRNFPREMARRIRNQKKQIAHVHDLLRAKVNDWNTNINIVQLGTTGNGKTHFGYVLAEVLFGTKDAAKSISAVNTWEELQNQFRSPVGFSGSHDSTEFEDWFMSRKTAGGGVIILDEFLSFTGLDSRAISERINVINKLYDLLDNRQIRFGERSEDASAFIVVTTGNSLQELFAMVDDTPEAEQWVRKILEHIRLDDILKFFKRIGFDAPKLARLGEIFLNGPLPRSESYEVAKIEMNRQLKAATHNLSRYYPITVSVDDEIVQGVVDRVSTVKMGMRFVNSAIAKVINTSVKDILFDLDGAANLEARLDAHNKIHWTVDGAEVIRVHDRADDIDNHWIRFSDKSDHDVDSTPQLADIEEQPKMRFTDENVYTTGLHEFGHWMVRFLLTGENQLQSISLIPTDEALGRVARDFDVVHDVSGISFLFKEIAFLAAGHRAVFLDGIYATGAGDGIVPQPKDQRQDDMYKIDRSIEAMISNGLLSDYSEFDAGVKRQGAKTFIRNVGLAIADYTIRAGNESRVFKPFFDDLLEKRFADEDMIKKHISLLDKDKIPDPDILYLKALAHGIRDAFENGSIDWSKRELRQMRKLGLEIFSKSAREIMSLKQKRQLRLNGGIFDDREIRQLETKFVEEFNNCEESLVAQEK